MGSPPESQAGGCEGAACGHGRNCSAIIISYISAHISYKRYSLPDDSYFSTVASRLSSQKARTAFFLSLYPQCIVQDWKHRRFAVKIFFSLFFPFQTKIALSSSYCIHALLPCIIIVKKKKKREGEGRRRWGRVSRKKSKLLQAPSHICPLAAFRWNLPEDWLCLSVIPTHLAFKRN